jgi:UDP-N-acetylglucosamine 2-epimerase (non-hydrolysing)
MKKIMTIVGTRPELIKLSRVINLFDELTNHILVHTGQNYDYELNNIFFQELDLNQPDYNLSVTGSNSCAVIAEIISKSYDVMLKEKPDALLLYGDTNSCLSIISAKKLKIPVFHMEAGNRCFDQRVPEEINRKIVDHLSDINMVLSENARQYLIEEGVKADTIFNTGSHLPEILDFYKNEILKSQILRKLKLDQKKFFVVSIHREENVDNVDNLKRIINSINTIAKRYKVPVIVSTHPRTKDRLNKIKSYEFDPLIRFLKPFGFFDYIKLQSEALIVLSDSGTISEEASIIGFPAITVRESFERPEVMDFGAVAITSLDKNKVIEAVEICLNKKFLYLKEKEIKSQSVYSNKNVSQQILNIVISYIDQVNRNVWKKIN